MDLEGELEVVRKIRDPIHRYIKVTRAENRIVDSPYFQRLANISQMHSAHLVYPGAQYSRKIHSLGAMHIAHRVLCKLLFDQTKSSTHKTPSIYYLDTPTRKTQGLRDLRIKEGLDKLGNKIGGELCKPEHAHLYLIFITRLAALLHDIGHAPHSHLFENASRKDDRRFNHETKGRQIVLEKLPGQIGNDGEKLLRKRDANVIARILSGGKFGEDGKMVQEPGFRRALPNELYFLHRMIDSALDVDKLDYLMRDAHYAGTPEYGTVDLDRLIDGIVVDIDPATGLSKIAYSSKSLDAVINALNAMFFMYSNIYLHKTVRTFDFATIAAFSGVAPFLQEFQNDEESGYDFSEFDEAKFLEILNARSKEEEGEGPFTQARDGLQDLRFRRKKYRAIVDYRAGIPLSAVPGDRSLEEHVSALRDRINKEHVEDFSKRHEIKVFEMREKNIRPIGLKLNEVKDFMNARVIYDSPTGELKRFKDYQYFYKTLSKVVVPVSWYVKYPDYVRIKKNSPDELRDLRHNIQQIIEEAHDEWYNEPGRSQS